MRHVATSGWRIVRTIENNANRSYYLVVALFYDQGNASNMNGSNKTYPQRRGFIAMLADIARSTPKSHARQRWQLIRQHMAAVRAASCVGGVLSAEPTGEGARTDRGERSGSDV